MLTKETLTQYLLNNFEGFILNSYFEQYLDLVFGPQELNLAEYTEKHHVIPVACYKLKFACKNRQEALKHANKDILNTTITLSYKNHCKAHYLLYFCTDGQLQQLMATPLDKLLKVIKKSEHDYYIRYLRNKHIKLSLTEDDFNLLQQYKTEVYNSNASNYWTFDEMNILINNYGKLSLTQLQKLLPNRSISAIRDKANKRLCLKIDNKWSPEELNILRKYYKDEGSKITSRLPKRNWHAITTQANILGLHTKNYWTDNELAILLKWYPEERGKVQIRLPKHSINNIYSKVKELRSKGLL